MPLTTKPTVLIVDDAPDNLMLIKMLLQAYCQVKMAENGQQALLLAQNPPYPELILLDVLMPEMDGYAACTELKRLPTTRDIAVIFLTSRNQSADRQRGYEVGAADYITKPIEPEVLQACVTTYLQLAAQSRMLAEQTHLLTVMQTTTANFTVSGNVDISKLPLTFPLLHHPLPYFAVAIGCQLQAIAKSAQTCNDAELCLMFHALNLIKDRHYQHRIDHFSSNANEKIHALANTLSLAMLADAQAKTTLEAIVQLAMKIEQAFVLTDDPLPPEQVLAAFQPTDQLTGQIAQASKAILDQFPAITNLCRASQYC